MCVQGSSCTYSGDLDPMHVFTAFQAEENVVCNFNCQTTRLVHSRHSVSRRAASDAGVYLQGLSSHFYLVVNPILVVSEMPGAPTRSTADNMTAARQKVGSPKILGANPSSYFLRDVPAVNRMDMFNGFINLYTNGRFFRQKEVSEGFWAEDPTALTELLVKELSVNGMSNTSGVLLSALLLYSAIAIPMSSRRSVGPGSKAMLHSLTSFSQRRCSATFRSCAQLHCGLLLTV